MVATVVVEGARVAREVVMAEGAGAGGWHFRDVVSGIGLVWSVFFVGVLGLVFRVGKVFREHEQSLVVVGEIRGELREIRGELKEMREKGAAGGEKRDREREALRLELKGDIEGLHRRLDGVVGGGRGRLSQRRRGSDAGRAVERQEEEEINHEGH